MFSTRRGSQRGSRGKNGAGSQVLPIPSVPTPHASGVPWLGRCSGRQAPFGYLLTAPSPTPLTPHCGEPWHCLLGGQWKVPATEPWPIPDLPCSLWPLCTWQGAYPTVPSKLPMGIVSVFIPCWFMAGITHLDVWTGCGRKGPARP